MQILPPLTRWFPLIAAGGNQREMVEFIRIKQQMMIFI
jgi:hypothetical protein